MQRVIPAAAEKEDSLMELTINEPGPDTPIRFNLSGVQVWARTREHAYQLLDAHTRQLPPEPAPDQRAAAMADRMLLTSGDEFDQLAALVLRNDELEQQVDELADALHRLWSRHANYINAYPGETGLGDLEAAEAALRKAGRS